MDGLSKVEQADRSKEEEEEEDLLRMEEDEVETSPQTAPNALAETMSAAADADGVLHDMGTTGAGGEPPVPEPGSPAGVGSNAQGGITSGFNFQTGANIFGTRNEIRTETQKNVYGSGLKRIFGTTLHCGPSRSSGSFSGSPARAAQKTAGFPPVYNVIRAAKAKVLGARVLGGNMTWLGGAGATAAAAAGGGRGDPWEENFGTPGLR